MSQASVSAWVVSSYSSTGREVYHTDESCRRLQEAKRYRPAADQELRDFRECKACSGDVIREGRDEYDDMTCPFCGEEFGNLPSHMRACK